MLLATLVTSAALAEGSADLAPYEIKWYWNGPMPQPGMDRVLAEVNKKLEPINATLNIVTTDFGNYVQKMQMVIASGEPFDLCYTSDWSLPFYTTSASGAFLPLNDLLDTYCPTIVDTLPDMGWRAATIDGNIYAIPNYQIWCKSDELVLNKELADKYGADIAALSDFTSPLTALEPFLQAIKENEPANIIPLGLCRDRQLWGDTKMRFGYETLGNGIAAINVNDEKCTVVNQFATEEFKEVIDIARDWYLKGYVKTDAASEGELLAEQKAGLVAATFAGAWKPGGDVVAKQQFGGRDVYDIQYSEAVTGTSMLVATMTAVSRASADPARALMFYDLLFSDKELYNLITLGMEGVDYAANEDGSVSMIPDSGYDVSTYGWEFGNQFNQKIMQGQAETVWADTIAMNTSAKTSPILGFSLDPSPVATESANCDSVCEEYQALLTTGSVDPETVYPEFIAKLEAVGASKIIEEYQRQVDEWLAAK
jgi:putative aldouronate transport system substrate-binding protein